MLDRDLAELYGAETKYLTRQVRRNQERFPPDLLLVLTPQEVKILRCQIGTSSWGGQRYLPLVFTEHGILMLSSVLRSERAIQVNIQIMRTFTSLRQMLRSHRKLWQKIEEMEKTYDRQFKVVFEALRKLLEKPMERRKQKIGFHAVKI